VVKFATTFTVTDPVLRLGVPTISEVPELIWVIAETANAGEKLFSVIVVVVPVTVIGIEQVPTGT